MGDKRYGDLNTLARADEDKPGKRRRSRSPEEGRVSWIRDPRPTFKKPGSQVEEGLQETQEKPAQETGQEREGGQETIRQEDQEEEGGSRRRGRHQETSQEMEERRTETRTPVRIRVARLNEKGASPGKFPGRQARIREYYLRKSPKAESAKERLQEMKKEPGTQQITEGAGNSPLLGDTGVTRPTFPSMDLVPEAEERGRLRKTEGGKKKALRALEERPPDPESPGKGSNKWKKVKRLKGSSQGKGNKDGGTGERGQVALMKMWLETGKGGFGSRKGQ